MPEPLITIFTAPKPFRDAHIATIQRNAIRSWLQLGEQVTVLLIGNEEGVADAAGELNVMYVADVARNSHGTPLISSIFQAGRMSNQSPLLAYVNSDIILLPDFLESARQVLNKESPFLMVGQRFDLEVREPIQFEKNWIIDLEKQLLHSGRLHPRGGSDYFIYPRACFQNVPDFAVGRAGWDNWMFYEARRQKWKVIDATSAIKIIHQNHDYSHLPGGQSHYRLPETGENVCLAGGKRAIFTLLDANFQMVAGKVKPVRFTWEKILREFEIFPLIALKSFFLANVVFFLFHPRKAWVEFRNRRKDSEK